MNGKIVEMYNKASEMVVKLGLPSDLLYDVISDIENNRDNLFIIKAHALMEAVIAYLVSLNIKLKNQSEEKTEKFAKFLSSLNMRGKNGSLYLARDLGIITEDIYDFMNTLADIRNDYAHNINIMKLPIEDYLNNHKIKRDKLDIIKVFKSDSSIPNSAIAFIILLGIHHCLLHVHHQINNKAITLLGAD